MLFQAGGRFSKTRRFAWRGSGCFAPGVNRVGRAAFVWLGACSRGRHNPSLKPTAESRVGFWFTSFRGRLSFFVRFSQNTNEDERMEALAIYSSIVIMLNAICVSIDKLMHNKDKPKLYLFIKKWWVYIDDLEVHDIFQAALYHVSQFKKWSLGSKSNIFRACFTSILYSFLMTTLMISISSFLLYGVETVPRVLQGFIEEPKGWASYGANFIFDMLSISVSIYMLSIAHEFSTKSKNYLAVLILLMDGVMAICASLLCVGFINWVRIGYGDTSIEIVYKVTTLQWDGYISGRSDDLIVGFYGLTTLAPTLIILAFLFVFFLSKPIVNASKATVSYILRRAIQDDPRCENSVKDFQPFTLLGILLTAIGSIP